jgi:hypothetical protein
MKVWMVVALAVVLFLVDHCYLHNARILDIDRTVELDFSKSLAQIYRYTELIDIYVVQLSDIHLDPAYSDKASPSLNCHNHLHSEHGRSNSLPPKHFGLPGSGCDTPEILIRSTMDFIRARWGPASISKPKLITPSRPLRFLLLTGDNSRHDRDNRFAKTLKETVEYVSCAIRLPAILI